MKVDDQVWLAWMIGGGLCFGAILLLLLHEMIGSGTSVLSFVLLNLSKLSGATGILVLTIGGMVRPFNRSVFLIDPRLPRFIDAQTAFGRWWLGVDRYGQDRDA